MDPERLRAAYDYARKAHGGQLRRDGTPYITHPIATAEIAANDWSLTPGRYVGVAPEEDGDPADFAESMRALHDELRRLDAEAARLAATIQANFEEMMG